MGRSYLSIKLALVFGIAVAVLVSAFDSVSADAPVRGSAVEQRTSPVVQESEEAFTTAGPQVPAVVCRWRGCPGAPDDLLPRSGRSRSATT